jgi:hypothetical protein
MDIEYIFENKKRHRNKAARYNYFKKQFSNQQELGLDKNLRQRALIRYILNNRKLKAAIVIGLVITTTFLVVSVALLFPLLKNIFDYIPENGISGITDKLVIFIETLWNGNK